LAERQRLCGPLVKELHAYMVAEREKLSQHAPVAKAMNYMFARWSGFTAFLEDGRICLSTDGVENPFSSSAGLFHCLWWHLSPCLRHLHIGRHSMLDVFHFSVADFLDSVVSA